MAFTTEFVMGAGGAVEVEEIPVSMSGSGAGTVYPLTTVDAGATAMIFVAGSMSPGSTSSSSRPHLTIGTRTFETPHSDLDGSNKLLGVIASGVVQVAVLSRFGSGTTSFSGTVYVARL